MGSFMAECDTAAPKVSQLTFSKVKAGKHDELELVAHFWPASPTYPPKFCVLDEENAYEWICDSWWTFPPFDMPMYKKLRGRICLLIDIHDGESVFQGHVFFDDDRYPNGTLPLPQNMVCIVLHTETVRRKDNNNSRAYGFNTLIVQPLSSNPKKYERLGVGVAIRQSEWHQTGFLGPTDPEPTTSIILV
jgi:hypothetical protein